MLQPASRTPLLLRQIPIWQNGIATGFIDLALERAFVYREHAPSDVVDVPGGELPREKEARYTMLERLADYDDALMEELISDIEPPRDQIFDDLTRDLREGLVAPVLIGSAEGGHGVTRLLKALRHEAPGIAQAARPARRRRRRPGAGPCDQDHPHRPWRQAELRPRAARRFRRRRHGQKRAGAKTALPACRG